MNKKLLLTLVSSMFLGLASCSNGNENDPKQPKEPEPEYVPVFVRLDNPTWKVVHTGDTTAKTF